MLDLSDEFARLRRACATSVLTAVVAIRTWRKLAAANRRDTTALKRLSSPRWAVIAIFFSLFGPGVSLQWVNRAISELRG